MAKKRATEKEQSPSEESGRNALLEGFMSIPALRRPLTDREMDELNHRAVAEEWMRELRDPERSGPADV